MPYTYKVQRHDETGWWQLVENNVVIGAWETKRDAMASYRYHVALAATGHKTSKCECSCHVHPKWGPEGLTHIPYCWEVCSEQPYSDSGFVG